MTCPECSGPLLAGHPAGALTFRHVPNGCSLGAAQDQTHAADVDRLSDPLGPVEIDRLPTSAEVQLLDALALPIPDAITVRRVTDTGSVTSRTPAA